MVRGYRYIVLLSNPSINMQIIIRMLATQMNSDFCIRSFQMNSPNILFSKIAVFSGKIIIVSGLMTTMVGIKKGNVL